MVCKTPLSRVTLKYIHLLSGMILQVGLLFLSIFLQHDTNLFDFQICGSVRIGICIYVSNSEWGSTIEVTQNLSWFCEKSTSSTGAWGSTNFWWKCFSNGAFLENRPLIDGVDTIAGGFNGGLQGQRERTRQGEDNLRHANFTGTYHAIRDVSSQSLREPWEKRSWSITWLPTRGDQQIQCRHARMHNTHPKEGCRKLARCFCHERKWNTLERRISIYIYIYVYILTYWYTFLYL